MSAPPVIVSTRHALAELQPTLEIFREAATVNFRARPDVRPWAEASGVLVPSEANRMLAGKPYNFAAFAPMASLVFGFFEGTAREMHLLKDTQGGASTHAFWSVAWMLAWDPGNIIFITKGRDSAKNAGQDRMDHIFEKIPQLGRGKNDGIPDSTAMVRRFPGGALFLGGCDSATTLIGQPASRIVLDEIKEHPFIDGKSTIDLGRMRIKMDGAGKLFAFSTAGDAVEYTENKRTGKQIPIATPESTPHLEYLTGTMEECRVPCPHCGHYQALEFERLKFGHCKEKLQDGEPPAWNRQRVVSETWYQCANPDCTDRNEDGTVRGRIEERHKWDMIQAHQWLPTNQNPHPGRRSASISVLYNLAAPQTSSWGHTALAFLDAHEKGTQEAMKAFHTDWLGKPWTPQRITGASMARILSLMGGYRAYHHDGRTPTGQIPWTTAETWFVGGLVDVQSDHAKWVIKAFARDGRAAVLQWGICQFVENLPEDVFLGREFVGKGEPEGPDGLIFPVIAVFMDVNGTRRSELYQWLRKWREEHQEIRWEGIAGRDVNHTRQVQMASWEKKAYQVLDHNQRPMWADDGSPITVPVNNIDAAFWETELYGECIDAFDLREIVKKLTEDGEMSEADADRQARENRRLWLPLDAPESFRKELCNMEQKPKAVGRAGHMEMKWVKKNRGPNDYGDLCKYGQVMLHVARQEGW